MVGTASVGPTSHHTQNTQTSRSLPNKAPQRTVRKRGAGLKDLDRGTDQLRGRGSLCSDGFKSYRFETQRSLQNWGKLQSCAKSPTSYCTRDSVQCITGKLRTFSLGTIGLGAIPQMYCSAWWLMMKTDE